MTYGPTDSTDSTDSVHDTTATDTTTTQPTPDAPNLRPMTTEPKPLPPGVERLPSGRFRAKLRDPTREAQGKTRARAALSLALEALEACDGVSQSTEGAVSAVRAVSAGRKGL